MISNIIFSLMIINLLLFKLILTKSQDDDEFFQNKRSFVNQIEDKREYVAILDKRRYLARTKFEEHCEPKGKILERICPLLEQCLLTPDQIKQNSLSKMLEEKEDAHQFLHTFPRVKRFFFINSPENYNERHVNERRHKGLHLYEHYCESTDRLPRSCPPIDRCQCNDCNKQ